MPPSADQLDGAQVQGEAALEPAAPESGLADFFVSYTKADTSWAEWIAWELEDAGYRVELQKWDSRPGMNFVLWMHAAAAQAERTIAVLSPAYLASQFTAPEWAAAFASDPKGTSAKLLPIRITDFDPPGLLRAAVYLDFVGYDEDKCRELLRLAAKRERGKPKHRPPFPGSAGPAAREQAKPAFPGAPGKRDSGFANDPPRPDSKTASPRAPRPPDEEQASPEPVHWRSHMVLLLCLLAAAIALVVLLASGVLHSGLSPLAVYAGYVLLGLGSSALTYGVLGSISTLDGKAWGFRLRLSGSAVILVIIVAGGALYERYRPAETFSCRLMFEDRHRLPAEVSGWATIVIGEDARTGLVRGTSALIEGIPAEYFAQVASLELNLEPPYRNKRQPLQLSQTAPVVVEAVQTPVQPPVRPPSEDAGKPVTEPVPEPPPRSRWYVWGVTAVGNVFSRQNQSYDSLSKCERALEPCRKLSSGCAFPKLSPDSLACRAHH
jgi:TIR domain